MKSFTHVVLPILLVAGVVFGITFIRMYSTEDPRPDEGRTPGMTGKAVDQPLHFFTVKAIAPPAVPNDRGEKEIAAPLRHMKYWDSEIEVNMPGHFEFWCQNRHAAPVSVRVPLTNCQCAGVELAAVPPDAYRDYLIGSALAGGPLCPAPGPAAILAHINLDRRLTWGVLHTATDQQDQTVPAAPSPTEPQFALVRLAWTGKAETGAKFISADLYGSIGDATPSHWQLGVETMVVPGFYVLRRDSANKWDSVREVTVGDLGQNATETVTVYLASATRPFLLPSVSMDEVDPCVTWTEPVPATDEDLANVRAFIATGEQTMRRFKSLYRMDVTVRERIEVSAGGRKEVRELDLGPFDRKVKVAAAGAGEWTLRVRGRVLGDVTFLSGAEAGRIDLGNAFAADQDRTRDVIILADRPGLELTLVESEVAPNYLRARLDPLEPVEGRKRYRLRVTVPKNSLFGALPEYSVVVLKTNSPTPRRLRLPVRGMTYDSGGPKL